MKNARWMRYKPLRKLVLTAAILFLTGAAFAAGVPRVNKTMPYAKGLNLSEWLEVGGFGNVRKCIYGKQDFENIKELEKRIRDLEEENEILKKAAAIFAQNPKR